MNLDLSCLEIRHDTIRILSALGLSHARLVRDQIPQMPGGDVIQRLLQILILAFPVSEVALSLVKRSRGPVTRVDRGSMQRVWLSVIAGVALGFGARFDRGSRIHWSLPVLYLATIGLLLAGLVIRWSAILTLGRLFTVDVAIHAEHEVVQHGLYRFMRHPSYTGLLVAFLGVGLYFENWLSIVGVMVPVTLGVLYRVGKEERALLDSLGPPYAAYCSRTKRFIPGVV